MSGRHNVEINDHRHEPQAERGQKNHPPPGQIRAILIWRAIVISIVWIIGHWVALH
jgi:hypothetical protein